MREKRNTNVFFRSTRVFLTNYETLLSEYQRILTLIKGTESAIILDESTKIKNPGSKITRHFLSIAKSFKKRVIMTGQPSSNRPEDIWSQIKFLDNGKSLGISFRAFADNVKLSNDLLEDRTRRSQYESTLEGLFDKIDHFAVRETKETAKVQLPKKKIVNVPAEWEKRQLEMYNELQEEFRLFIKKNGVNMEDDAAIILKRITRLIQITCNPLLVDENYKSEPGKFYSDNELKPEDVMTIMCFKVK